jgi:hypothetical protein
MPNYLFLTDSHAIKSKLENNLPNIYQDYGILLVYEYNDLNIYINKIIGDDFHMSTLFKRIGRMSGKFDKIFFLLANNYIGDEFKLYINGLACNLVNAQNDVIVFMFGDKNLKYDFEYTEGCYFYCCCCYDDIYKETSNAIHVKIKTPNNFNFEPEFFIDYIKNNKKNTISSKIITSETIIRDDGKSQEQSIPVVIAEPVINTNTNINNYYINTYSKVGIEPSAPKLLNVMN